MAKEEVEDLVLRLEEVEVIMVVAPLLQIATWEVEEAEADQAITQQEFVLLVLMQEMEKLLLVGSKYSLISLAK